MYWHHCLPGWVIWKEILLLLLLNRMLPDITRNTWAKNNFYNFLRQGQFTMYNHGSLESGGPAR
jgi:hypothetical protein